jgi:hypothetical protein
MEHSVQADRETHCVKSPGIETNNKTGDLAGCSAVRKLMM